MCAKHIKRVTKTGFKKLKGINLPAQKQMLIRAICLNFDERPKWEREKIQRLCDECGGAYSAALFRLMTSTDSVTKISMDYYVSESVIYRIRKEFYESWYKK